MPRLARIEIYPIKSMDPQSVESAEILPTGALRYDRQWALFDAAGQVINAKRTPIIQKLRSECDWTARVLTLRPQGECLPISFHLDRQRTKLEKWLSDWFSHPVFLKENSTGGFPDDVESPGPTIICTATLKTVSSWFAPLTEVEVRRRFRANLEIEADEPFWEDRLFADEGDLVRFRMGTVEFGGTNPCQRCPVPSRDSHTGEPIVGFQHRFAELRAQTLPDWANRERFNHFYRLAVNTRLLSRGEGIVRVGDKVELV